MALVVAPRAPPRTADYSIPSFPAAAVVVVVVVVVDDVVVVVAI